ncbi:hypothetical protein ACTWP5_14545 [Streptomyces sp. 4N509B]|uniref:hypothetical protein n=1 Tax=Streptomyces sp. 4N509B TaxID=3457413 RepID=UPI003FD5C4C4
MTSHDIVTRHLCVAVDVEKYSRLDTPQQEAAQADLLRVLDEAAALSGLDRTCWSRQAQGDQEFSVLPHSTPEAVVLGVFVRHLTAMLAAHNAWRPSRDRMRLRLAMDLGVARDAALGHSGPAPVAVARYLNARVFKRALAAMTATNLAVIVSDRLYQDVVQSREHGLDPKEYAHLHVIENGFRGYGWIYIPGQDPEEVRSLVQRLSQEQSRGTGLSGDHSQARLSSIRRFGGSHVNTPAEIAALAATAASAVVGAMATDTWQYVRNRCARVFGRHVPEREMELMAQLDEFERSLASVPAERENLLDDFRHRTAEELAAIAALSEDAADELRSLAYGTTHTLGRGDQHSSGPVVGTLNVRGDSNVSGRDTNIWRFR